MQIIFSHHAIWRMAERSITRKEVIETLFWPDKVDKRNDTEAAIKKTKDDQLLIVIYKEGQNSKKIITVIKTSKLKKYLM